MTGVLDFNIKVYLSSHARPLTKIGLYRKKFILEDFSVRYYLSSSVLKFYLEYKINKTVFHS